MASSIGGAVESLQGKGASNIFLFCQISVYDQSLDVSNF